MGCKEAGRWVFQHDYHLHRALVRARSLQHLSLSPPRRARRPCSGSLPCPNHGNRETARPGGERRRRLVAPLPLATCARRPPRSEFRGRRRRVNNAAASSGASRRGIAAPKCIVRAFLRAVGFLRSGRGAIRVFSRTAPHQRNSQAYGLIRQARATPSTATLPLSGAHSLDANAPNEKSVNSARARLVT